MIHSLKYLASKQKHFEYHFTHKTFWCVFISMEDTVNDNEILEDAGDSNDQELDPEQEVTITEEEKPKSHMSYSSFFIFPPSFIIRIWANKLIQHKYWKRLIILLIISNCILLACWDPLDPDAEEQRNKTISYIDTGFLVCYTIEMIITLFVLGAFAHPHSYFRDGWNYLDFFVVVIGWISLVFTGVKGLSTLRALRAIRPLRLISNLPQLRRIIDAMIIAIPFLLGALFLMLIFFIIYGLFGVILFNGALRKHCVIDGEFDENMTCSKDPGIFGGYECEIGKCKVTDDNIDYGYFNFDNVFYAWIAIFLVINVEGWTRWAYLTMDATSNFACLYYIALIIIGAMFWLNLLLAVVSVTMSNIPEPEKTESKPNWISKLWKKFKQFMKRPEKQNIIYRFFDRLVNNRISQVFLMIVILINLVVLAMPYRHQPDSYTLALQIIDLICLIIFTIEMFFRLIGIGIWKYYSNVLNCIDCLVVITGWIEIIVLLAAGSGSGGISTIRVLRALRYVKEN